MTNEGSQLIDSLESKHSLDSISVADLIRYKAILELISTYPSVYELDGTALAIILPYTDSSGMAEGFAKGILGSYNYTFLPDYQLPVSTIERELHVLQSTFKDLTVFPNPVGQTVTFKRREDCQAKIYIFDMQGILVSEVMWNLGIHIKEVNLSVLNNGIYLYRYSPENGNSVSGKIIVNK